MIVKIITDDYYFWNWLKKSDSYKNNFSLEGAKALQAYLDESSDELGYDYEQDGPTKYIEFDPVAWCCEFSEYASALEAYNDYTGGTETLTAEQALQYFQDNTTVIELDNGGIILGEF